MFDPNKLSACDEETIRNAYMIKKNSVSPSIILFGTRYYNEPVAAKIFTLFERNVITSVRQYLSTRNKNYLDFYIRAMHGLIYECQVYQVINRLMDYNVSPNFVRLYTVERCDYNFIASLLKRPVEAMLNTLELAKVIGVNILKKLPVLVIVTRRPKISNDFMTFLSRKDIVYDDIMDVIFQIIYTLKALIVNGVSHQDLHLSNILVEELDQRTDLFYTIDDKTSFQVRTRFIARLFDWDTAYVKSLGKNKFLSPEDCQTYGHCNVSNRKFDLFLFLCRLSMMCSNDLGYRKLSSSVKQGMCDNFLMDVFKAASTSSEQLYDNIKKYWYNNKSDQGFYCFLRNHLPDAVMKDHLWILKSPYFDRLRISTPEIKIKDKKGNMYSLRNIMKN